MCLHSISKVLIPLTIVVVINVSDSVIDNGNNTLHGLLQTTPSCGSKLDKAGLCLFENNCSKANLLSERCMISLYSVNPSSNVTTEQHRNDTDALRPTLLEAWIYGMLSAIVISFSGVAGYILSPLITGSYQQHVLNTLIGLSFGSLTSTALLQLIPEAYNLHAFLPNYMNTGLFTIITIWILYVIQTLSEIIFNGDKAHEIDVSNHRNHHGHSHSHKHCFHAMKNASINKVSSEECSPVSCFHDQENNHQEVNANTTKQPFDDNHKKMYMVSDIEENPGTSRRTNKPSSLAWMIILGDGLHNFLDGISVGAGYTQSTRIGLSLTLAIACEEYPHELGDFAILIQSGLSVRKAALYNYLSATSIIVGVAVGIVLGELKFSPLIFSSSAGLFLYIALANLMGELRNMIKTALVSHKKRGLLMLLLQNTGFFTGFIALLYIIPANNDW